MVGFPPVRERITLRRFLGTLRLVQEIRRSFSPLENRQEAIL